MLGVVSKYISSNRATTMIDYALIITGISIVVTVFVMAMGENLNLIFEKMVNILSSSNG